MNWQESGEDLKIEIEAFDSTMASGKKKTLKGSEAFHAHYGAIYRERWEVLKGAMGSPREAEAVKEGLLRPYHLDGGSLWPPSLLMVKAGEAVLDLCSAPGGKALQLALALGGNGRLVLNELSRSRRNRLERVVEEHLEPSLRKNIEIWGKDGSRLGEYIEDRFDAILLDAPCSSERHLIENPSQLETWGPKRTKQLAHRQMGLLCSALELLKPGGRLVYSTCSISPEENENLIEKFIKKRKGRVESVDQPGGPGEKKSYGRLILPDTSFGQGPMFACLMMAVEKEETI